MSNSYENFMNLCPRCGNPLPCILHDQRHLKELLHPVEPAPTFEKTAEWEYVNDIYSIARLSETTALIGGKGGKLKLIDFTDPTNPRFTELGDFGSAILNIAALTETTALLGRVVGNLELWEISKEKLRAYYERKAATPEIPPVPEE